MDQTINAFNAGTASGKLEVLTVVATLGCYGELELFQLLEAVTDRLAKLEPNAAIYTARARNVMAGRVGKPDRSYVELTG